MNSKTAVSILPPIDTLITGFERYKNSFSDLSEILDRLAGGGVGLDYMYPLEECVANLTIELMKNGFDDFEFDDVQAFEELKAYVDYEITSTLENTKANPDPDLLDQVSIDLADVMLSVYAQFFDKITKTSTLWDKLMFETYNGVTIQEHEHLTVVVFSRSI